MDREIQLEAKGIRKSFGGNHVLKGVDFTLRKGEVHALLGINGAGKSTLIKIISGALQMDAGELVINGKSFTSLTPKTAKENSIVTIYQETSLYMHLSVLENLFVGKMMKKGAFIDWKSMEKKAKEVFDHMGIDVPLYERLGDLGKATAQLIEIAKCLIDSCKVLIMDEPTSSLSRNETINLFNIIRNLKAEGRSIVYISHKMEEIYEITDSVTILRDGVVTGVKDTKDATPAWVSEQMLGRKLESELERTHTPTNEPVLQVKGLTHDRIYNDITFETRRGEILALVGLVGSGRTEVARAIFGIDKYDKGEIILKGKPMRRRNTQKAIQDGVSMVPEDRGRQGLILQMRACENMVIPSLPQVSKAGWRNFKKEAADVKELSDSLLLNPNDPQLTANSFSGGNQQKVVLGKWLETHPDLLIVDEPTCGVDVGAKMEIYKLMDKLCAQGISILMISSDFEEVHIVADRILVMKGGQIIAEMPNENLSPTEILQYAMVGVG